MLRANTSRTGTINEVTPRMWIGVTWDDAKGPPKLLHLYELRTLPIDGSSSVGV